MNSEPVIQMQFERGAAAPQYAATDEVMALLTVNPTRADVEIARTVARNTTRRAETVSRGLTWGADEKILLVLAVAGWSLPGGNPSSFSARAITHFSSRSPPPFCRTA